MYDKLLFERQELVNNILLTKSYLETVTDEVERKHITYQLQAMDDYRTALEARISLHRNK